MTLPPLVDAFVVRRVIPPLAPGALTGSTFAVKDLFDVAGEQTGCGNPTWARTHPPATAHAAVIERLLRAGARLLGKVRTDEMAYSLDGSNVHEGAPLNPAAPDRLTGGSSSGCASAVAAGEVDFAVGTDTAGSVRVPAAWCGLYGIRPTHGSIDTHGLTPLAPSFDVIGWFARDERMLCRVAQVLLPGEWGVPDRPDARPDWTLVHDPALERGIDAEVAAAVQGAFTRVAALTGMRLQLPVEAQLIADCLRVLQGAEAWRMHSAWIERARPLFGPAVAARFAAARALTAADVQTAMQLRERLVAQLDEALPRGRILVLPAVPGPPLPRGATAEQLQARRSATFLLTALASLTGRPQITVPRRSAAGLPIGVGLLGWRGSERELLALAALLG